ncbi:Succinyl-diaminopimelate desuccinylase [compost metagenome]
MTPDVIKQRVETMLSRHGLGYQLHWRPANLPFLTPGGALLQAVNATVAAECGKPPEASTAGGTSDGRFIAPTGAEVVELGPVNRTIHKVNECVSVADLETLARMYERILGRLLA